MKYVAIALLLSGCVQSYEEVSERNDKVIAEKAKCEYAGMDYIINDFGRLYCSVKKESK